MRYGVLFNKEYTPIVCPIKEGIEDFIEEKQENYIKCLKINQDTGKEAGEKVCLEA